MHMFEPIPTVKRDMIANSFLPFWMKVAIRIPLMRMGLKYYTKGIYSYIAARTIFIDNVVEESLKEINIQQIVNMGAGFDSRALRYEAQLKELNINYIELDLPPFIEEKTKKLKEIHPSKTIPSHLKLIPIDFSQASLKEILVDNPNSGYDPKKKTLFIWEGVAIYLPQTAVDTTLNFISTYSAQGSIIIWDYCFEEFQKHPEHYYRGKESLEFARKNRRTI